MKMNNKNLFGAVVGLAGLAYGMYCQHKMNKVVEKVGIAISDLDTSITIDVPKKIVDTAIEKAVDREVSSLADKAAISVSAEITSNMKEQVKVAIGTKFDNISEQVAVELSDQVSKIDKDALADKVSKKAEQKVLSKLDKVLDESASTFNKELKSMAKVYSSVAYPTNRYGLPKSIYFTI